MKSEEGSKERLEERPKNGWEQLEKSKESKERSKISKRTLKEISEKMPAGVRLKFEYETAAVCKSVLEPVQI